MAIVVTAVTVKTRLPEFNSLADKTIELWITEAKCRVNETQWGTKKGTDGVIFLTAHLLAIFVDDGEGSPADSDAGPVVSEREGQISVTFAVADHMKDAGELATTKYGRHFVTLRREIFVTRKV